MAKPFLVEESLSKLSDPHPKSEDFRQALIGISRQSREDVVRLWLTEGIPFAFRGYPSVYEEIRAWLGAHLGVCPKEITLVGSARIGFSFAGPKFGRSFDQGSDLDLSVVSETLFGKIAETFAAWKQDYSKGMVKPRNDKERLFWDQNIEFGERNLPLGFFDPNKLPTLDRYPVIQQIQDAMWALTKKLEATPDVRSRHRASLRAYRTWQALVARVSFNLYKAISRS